MLVTIGVGRIGSHLQQGDTPGAIAVLEHISAEELLNKDSRNSLIGKKVTVNHLEDWKQFADSPEVGTVSSVDSKLINGVLHCHAEITDQKFSNYLERKKKQGIVLESSPEFFRGLKIDKFGRRNQINRRYTSISILSEGIPGNGGSDVIVKYKYQGDRLMEEMLKALMDRLDALEGKFDAFMDSIEMGGGEGSSIEEASFNAGIAYADCRSKLTGLCAAKNINFVPPEENNTEEMLRTNLAACGFQVENRSLSYMQAILDLAPTGSSPKDPDTKDSGSPSGIKLSFKKKAK